MNKNSQSAAQSGAPTPNPLLLSLDIGNANTKIRSANLSTEFRSIAGRLSRSRRFGDITNQIVFTFENETLAFGDAARDLVDGEPVSYTSLKRYTSGFYKKLVAAALWRTFKDTDLDSIIKPVIVASIPVVEFANGKADDVKKNIAGAYVMESITEEVLYVHVDAENVVIIPEGAGSYYQAISGGTGLGGREVAILDIGFYTTDLVIFNKGQYVTGSAHSCKHGVQQVAAGVHQWLMKHKGYAGDLWAVDNALDSGSIEIGNQCETFAGERDALYADLLDDLLAFYESNVGSRTPAAVLLSGGGAKNADPFVPDQLKATGWRVVSGDPRRANVDGSYEFLVQREAKRGS